MISWNDILTILISVVSVGADVIMVLVIYHLYQNVKKKNEKIQQNSENVKLLKLIKGSVKQEDLLPHCKKLTDVEKQILILYFCQDMKLDAISIELNLSLDYVKKVKNIAIAKME